MFSTIDNEIIEFTYKITYQLALGTTNLLPNDHHLVNTDLSTMLEKSYFHKTEWLKTIESARTCQMPDEMKTFNYARNFMSNWLGTKTYRSRYKHKYQ